jgi:DNA transformation protein and related proteins
MAKTARENEYLAHIVDLLRRWAPVTVRRMFSGSGLYRGDVIFALVIDDVLYFKTDAVNRPRYEAAGMAPFSYMRAGRPAVITSYHAVPSDLLEGDGALAAWAEDAVAAALRFRAAKGRPAKKPGAKTRSRKRPAAAPARRRVRN